MADFPSYVPSSRSFTPGSYPQKSYRALSGYIVKRTFGNKASGAKLELEFKNISDQKAATIVNHYYDQTGRNSRFKLSNAVTSGMSNTPSGESLAEFANGSIDDLRWEYESPPQVQSVRPNVSSVRVSLTGEIKNVLMDDK